MTPAAHPIDRLTGPLALLALLALFVGYTVVLAIVSGELADVSGIGQPPDTNLGFSPAELTATYAAYTDAGMALYWQFRYLDLGYPMVFSLLGAAALARVWRSSGRSHYWRLAVAMAVFDYLENFALFLALDAYPDIPWILATGASGLGILKYAAIALTLAFVLVGVIISLRDKLRSR